MRCSAQTVYSWKYANAIPRYRRSEVLDAVHRMRLQLPVETIIYLSKVF
ncbi:hypothetical protein V474_22795 [Novosphingobium barchaimii LL02]|uniref:Uncharacterized protein n=1 Tax=Novosphingobium barchaimii LL02 TaxID=1114963 RepID=A0A0J7XNU2_9SPHN|nr:hypothetical protein V474_22795 [Novosphingobium barchaimii LL02]